MTTFPLAHPGRPDTRTATAYLLWLARRQWRTLAIAMVCGTVWMLSLALVPAALGRGIDEGIVAGDRRALVLWSAAVVGLALTLTLSGAVRHYFAVHNWLAASYRTAQIVDDAVIDRGSAITRRHPSGEVVAIFATDIIRVGSAFDVLGRLSGAIVSYVVVAAILLSSSGRVGLVLVVGGPVIALALTLIVRPLQHRQAEQREESGRLTTLGADTVAGLRILRGIGGEQTFLRRYVDQSQHLRRVGVRVAGYLAALEASQVLLPGLFAVAVVWLGARAVVAGDLSAGQLVAFYGYAAFLTMPLRTVTEAVDKFIRARIATRKVLRILAVPSDHPETVRPHIQRHDDHVRGRNGEHALVDGVSGAVIPAGLLTAVVSARPEDSAALADRLGRIGPGPHDVTLHGIPLADLPLADVRRRVVVSDAEPHLFTGRLRDALSLHRLDGDVLAAIEVTSGADVLEALPDGLDSTVEERGRSFSGGQRQRLALARALLTDAEVLVLVEPTSAVDAHTEARIAERLAEHRRGRTTVVTTASPLVLDHADHVVLLDDGVVTATGTHHELLEHTAYRRIVHRGEGE